MREQRETKESLIECREEYMNEKSLNNSPAHRTGVEDYEEMRERTD